MKIRVSVFVYILALAMTFFGFFGQFVSYFAAVVFHEMAHAECARRLGYVLNEFRLMPYGAALIGEFEGADWKDECRIAAAGPALNIILAVLCLALWWLIPASYYFTENFAYANMSIAAVNLLPVYPLDGGRITLAAASRRVNRQTAYKRLRISGYAVSAVFAGLFVASCFYGANLSFASMSAFILLSTVVPDNRCSYQRLYQLSARGGRTMKGLKVQEVILRGDAPARMFFRALNSNYYTEFRIVDGSMRTLARISETELEGLSASAFAGTAAQLIEEKSALSVKKTL